jgi:hypothetical protein
MLADSVRFLHELSNWMSTHYLELFTRSRTSDKECWELISHCVRTVFSVLGTVRSPGRAPFTEGTKERRRRLSFGGHSRLAVLCETYARNAS